MSLPFCIPQALEEVMASLGRKGVAQLTNAMYFSQEQKAQLRNESLDFHPIFNRSFLPLSQAEATNGGRGNLHEPQPPLRRQAPFPKPESIEIALRCVLTHVFGPDVEINLKEIKVFLLHCSH